MSIHVTSRVWRNSKATNGALITLLVIADCAGHDGRAWPSVAYLCTMTRLSESSVHAAIAKLVALKEITVDRNSGPHGCNVYTIQGVQNLESRGPESGVKGSRICTQTVNEPSENQKTPPTPPQGGEQETLYACVTADGEEIIRPSRHKPEPGSDEDPGFCAFWSAYPRHVAKGPARKAWRSAVRKGVAAGEIIAGAEHYRDDPRRRARAIEYTAHPATWLNGERWQDFREAENAARYSYSNNPYDN